jgi:hypothetical protein
MKRAITRYSSGSDGKKENPRYNTLVPIIENRDGKRRAQLGSLDDQREGWHRAGDEVTGEVPLLHGGVALCIHFSPLVPRPQFVDCIVLAAFFGT